MIPTTSSLDATSAALRDLGWQVTALRTGFLRTSVLRVDAERRGCRHSIEARSEREVTVLLNDLLVRARMG